MSWADFTNKQCHQFLQLFHFSTTNGAFYLFCSILVLLFILSTNTLVLYGLFKTKQIKGFTNRMFIIISISDLICGCAVIPLNLINIYLDEESKDCMMMSSIESWIYIILSFGSSINTCALAIDRFIFIRYPFKYQKIASKRRILLLVATMSYSIGVTMVFSRRDEELIAIFAISAVTIILVVSLGVNIKLVKYIKKQTDEIRRLSNTFVKTSYKQRATKTVFLIIIILVVTHLPQVGLFSYMFVTDVDEKGTITTFLTLYNWTRLLVLMNAGLNALVYISRNKLIIKLYKRKLNNL